MTETDRYEDGVEEGGSTDRVLTLTDGVVAIAMTLLALDLKPDLPKGATSRELWRYLRDNAGQYRSFLIAFLIAVMFWRVHHRVMATVTRSSPGLVSANVLFLFSITILPLTTYLLGEYGVSLAVTLFAANILLMSLSTHLLLEVSQLRGLRTPLLTKDQFLASRIRFVVLVVIDVFIAVIAWVIDANASYLFFLFFFADLPSRVIVPRARPHSSRSAR